MMFAANVAAMTPQELLQNLLNRAGLSPNALANELHAKGVRQPTLSRFLAGRVGDPRSSWMAPVAKRFNISEHALRDEEEATRVAQELGFAEGYIEPIVKAQPRQTGIDAGMIVLQVADVARSLSPSKRATMAALLQNAANTPDEAADIAATIRVLVNGPSGNSRAA
jgi:hypothetical protein